MKSKASAKIKYFIVLSGVLLAIGTELKSDSPNVWYVLWAIFPYGAYYLAAWKAESQSLGAAIGGGILILGADILLRIQVLYFPGSSTDSIAFLAMPFWQMVVIMPFGFLLGWVVEKWVKRNSKQE